MITVDTTPNRAPSQSLKTIEIAAWRSRNAAQSDLLHIESSLCSLSLAVSPNRYHPARYKYGIPLVDSNDSHSAWQEHRRGELELITICIAKYVANGPTAKDFSQLRSLILRRHYQPDSPSAINLEDLENILKACPELRKLELQLKGEHAKVADVDRLGQVFNHAKRIKS